MRQMSFGDSEYLAKKKQTRREIFLGEMEQVVPWEKLLKLIEPHYPVAGRGRQPYPLQTMLRVHLMQNWFGLSDPAMEEALYEIGSMRGFSRLSLTQPIPDETTILNFRRLIEQNERLEALTRRLQKDVESLKKQIEELKKEKAEKPKSAPQEKSGVRA